MTVTQDDRALLNQLAEQARHWRDIDDLRAQQAELRARQTNRTTDQE